MTIGKNKQVQFVIIQKDSSLKDAAAAAAQKWFGHFLGQILNACGRQCSIPPLTPLQFNQTFLSAVAS